MFEARRGAWCGLQVLVVSFVFWAFTLPLLGQGTARVSGVVRDPSGAVIPAASVYLRNEATGTEQKTTADASGFYAIDYVFPKTYTLRVQATGFKTYVQSGILVEPAQRLAIDVKLELGTQVQQVEVTSSSVTFLPTSSGAEIPVISANEIQNLSIEGRNSMELLTLFPGVVNSGFNPNFGSSTGQGINQFNVNGLRNDQNSVRLDNANMIDPGNNGGFIIEPNNDMIQEFSLKLSAFEADQGAAGMIVDAVTKSGGNNLHGELYYFGRNAALNSNDFSTNAAGFRRPNSRFNYPGASIGGPVRFPHSNFNKHNDKAFFWLGAEAQRQLPDFGSQFAVVPSLAMRKGDFSELLTNPACKGKSRCFNMPTKLLDPASGWSNTPLPGNILPPSEIDPNTSILLNTYPLPNFVDPKGNFNFAGDPLLPLNRDEENIRLDYNFTDNTHMYVRLSRNKETQLYPFGLWSGIGSGWTSNVPDPSPALGDDMGKGMVVNLVHTFSPTLTNEIQFNAQKLTLHNNFADPSRVSKSALGFKFKGLTFKNSQVPGFQKGVTSGTDFLPQITDQWNFFNGGNPGTGRWGEGGVGDGIFADKTIFELIDNVTKVHGTHTFKFGGAAERTRNDQNGGPVTEGLLITAENWGGFTTGNSFGDILANDFRAFQQGVPNNDGLWRFWTLEGYAQDSWKVARNLTLNYGVRLSWLQPWYEARGHTETFIPSSRNPQDTSNFLNGIVTPATGTIPNSVFPNPKPLLQPRIGFAWDMFGKGTTVFRGGFGFYVSRDQGNTAFSGSNSPPFSFTATVAATGGTPALTLANLEATDPFTNLGNVSLNVNDFRDQNVPQTYEWNLGFTRHMGLRTVVDVAYVANVSRHLFRGVNENAIAPGAMFIPGTTDCCVKGDTTTSDFRPFKPFGNITFNSHSDTANYNSMQVTVRRTVSHGLTLLGSYTWSKTLGHGSTFQGLADPFDTRRNYGFLPFDRASILNFSYIYPLPKVGSRLFGGHKYAKGALDDWQFSGITHYTGGAPIFIGTPTVNCVTDPAAPQNLCKGVLDSGQSQFQGSAVGFNGTPDIALRPIINFTPGKFNNPGDHFFDPNSVQLPGIGQFGTFETPLLRGPGNNNWDMTISKRISFRENRSIEFRFSAFNIFNHPNFDTRANSFQTTPIFNFVIPANATSFSQGKGQLANGDQLGVISTKIGHREMEYAVKVFF